MLADLSDSQQREARGMKFDNLGVSRRAKKSALRNKKTPMILYRKDLRVTAGDFVISSP